jgi:hypothetical protein
VSVGCWIGLKTTGIKLCWYIPWKLFLLSLLTKRSIAAYTIINSSCVHSDNNQIASIPSEIGSLNSLQELDLGEYMVLDGFENCWN